ncbi:MAG: type II toxin-antitoxin system VapC family toxin [Nitrospirae bacterium]|nr:type II toxin-antitoxin system VapC family toxin [Nitrospirota bacterium]
MFILDSYALLCLFDRKRKKEGHIVKKHMEEAEAGGKRLLLSKINEGEVFYKLYKYLGRGIAYGFREDLRQGLIPVQVVSVNDKRAEAASEIKANYPVSYADAFCIALAVEMGMPVLTGDPEFRSAQDIIEIVELV